MSFQLKVIQGEHSKGKSADKVSGATEELQHLMLFNSSISHLWQRQWNFAFVSMYNFTLTRRDVYLAHVKSSIKPDTLAALREAPLASATLFLDTILRKAEEDISKFEDIGHSHASSASRKYNRYNPYKRSDKSYSDAKFVTPAWKNIGRVQKKKSRIQAAKYSSRQAKGQSSFK